LVPSRLGVILTHQRSGALKAHVTNSQSKQVKNSMLQLGDPAPSFSLPRLDGSTLERKAGEPTLLLFFETDCPTCQLTLPYLMRLAEALGNDSERIVAISQDGESATRQLIQQAQLRFPVALDTELAISQQYNPISVPALYLVNRDGRLAYTLVGFDKEGLNTAAALMCQELGASPVTIAPPHDGAPDRKPGCASRHLERAGSGHFPQIDPATLPFHVTRGSRATRLELDDSIDLYEYCMRTFGDPLPVVPPTVERVERMLEATTLAPDMIVGHVPPNYGAATIEKIAANAVMAGCDPQMMRVLIPTIRAACDERLNLHGIQATTHFAAPLVIVNGPIRTEIGFACRSNVLSNVARANSTLGRALQLVLVNLGGARPGEIDMSTLGNPGKFSYCIAENEEESPWPPFHVDLGFRATQSTVTLFGAEPPRGISEHNARRGRDVLKAISRTLATIGTYLVCSSYEAMVLLCPEHVKTLQRDGFTKEDVRDCLFENTAIPEKAFSESTGEGTQFIKSYDRITIDGELCYRKFRERNCIRIVVAGGTAGKFSAVIGSWATGPRGSQMVTYPIQ
jgi:peroxiredoxin